MTSLGNHYILFNSGQSLDSVRQKCWHAMACVGPASLLGAGRGFVGLESAGAGHPRPMIPASPETPGERLGLPRIEHFHTDSYAPVWVVVWTYSIHPASVTLNAKSLFHVQNIVLFFKGHGQSLGSQPIKQCIQRILTVWQL